MKKIFLIVLILFLITNQSFAFELSQEKNTALINAKSKIWLLKPEKNINWYYKLKSKLEENINNTQNEEKIFILTELKNEVWYIIDSYKPVNFDKINHNIINTNSNFKTDFYNNYWKNILNTIKLRTSCTKHYDFVDKIAKKNNFPTALLIATWSKESNCWLFNPYNTWGPFQITSQYHKPWEISLEEFESIAQNYIDFSKWKIKYFNSNSSYQKRFWNEKIDFSYDNYTLKDLQLYAVLYNGIWKTTDYKTNKFANWNLNSSLKSDTDWIVTLFLKILNWQIKNNK